MVRGSRALRRGGHPGGAHLRDQARPGRDYDRAGAPGRVPFAWFTADEEFGQNPGLRTYLETMRSPTSWLCRRTPSSPTPRARELSSVSIPRGCTGMTGSAGHTGSARKGSACMTGRWLTRGSRSPVHDPPLHDDGELAFYHCHNPSGEGFGELVRQPAPAGPWRNASRRGKARPAWIITRSASTTPGTGTSPWPCSPMRSWPSWPARPKGDPAPVDNRAAAEHPTHAERPQTLAAHPVRLPRTA